MKLQTIGRCLDLLQADYQAKRKAAKEVRAKFNQACEAAETRGGIPSLFGPSEDEAIKAEQELADAETALRDFMNTNWRC